MMHFLLGMRSGEVCHHGYLATDQPKRHLGPLVSLLVAQAETGSGPIYCHLLSDSEIAMLEELAPQPGNAALWQSHDDYLMRMMESDEDDK
jgi:hypothetical protein